MKKVEKQNVIHLYNETSFQQEKTWNFVACYKVDEFQKDL
jgi:hypothetical protein